MQRPQNTEYSPFSENYIQCVPEGNFEQLWAANTQNCIDIFKNIAPEKENYAYAEGKWTYKEMLMHLIDTERIFAYRTLVALRNDSETQLYSFDENKYAANAPVNHRTLADLITEFEAGRQFNLHLFSGISEEQSQQICHAGPYIFSVRALAHIIIGHAQHHINILKERYL